MRSILIIVLAWLVFECGSPASSCHGQSQSESDVFELEDVSKEQLERERLEMVTPQPSDLIARVAFGGSPVQNLAVELAIKRTYGFFSGSGNPPIQPRTLSNKLGEVRFDNSEDWIRDRVVGQIAFGGKSSRDADDVTQAEINGFNSYTWTVRGYWPEPNCRIQLQARANPKLWCQQEGSVELTLPPLHCVAVRAVDMETGKSYAQVRIQLTNRFTGPIQYKGCTFQSVDGYAWTDNYGIATLWMPEGEYRVMHQPTVAFEAIELQEKHLTEEPVPQFGKTPDGFWTLQARGASYKVRQQWLPDEPNIQVAPAKNGKVLIQNATIKALPRVLP